MINWNIFDKIYCIHYLPYKERYTNIIKTLINLNIYQQKNFSFYYTTKNIYFDYLYEILKEKEILFCDNELTCGSDIQGYIKNNKVFNLAINTYNLIKECLLLNYNRVLIIEDDITPLKDKNLFSNIINNIPLDYNIISMDYWFRDGNKTIYQNNSRKINDYFYDVKTEKLVNAGFIVYDRTGMMHWMDTIEQYFWNSDYPVSFHGQYDDWNIKRAISKVPCAIQIQNYYEMNHTQNMKWNYNNCTGINLENYEAY